VEEWLGENRDRGHDGGQLMVAGDVVVEGKMVDSRTVLEWEVLDRYGVQWGGGLTDAEMEHELHGWYM